MIHQQSYNNSGAVCYGSTLFDTHFFFREKNEQIFRVITLVINFQPLQEML